MPAFLTASANVNQAEDLPGTPTCPSRNTMASARTPSCGARRSARSRPTRYAALRAAGVREPVTRLPPAGRPTELLRSSETLRVPCSRIIRSARINAVAQRQRVHLQPFCELVNRLFEAEDALHLARCAKCGARSGVREHIVVIRTDVWAW